MTKDLNTIEHVSDTAIWVAAYRDEESNRKDALFKDPYVKELIGPHGKNLATRTQGSRYTAWSVVIRTFIIDEFIADLIKSGIDTVINLGAGLDTRPYRLNLPRELKWVEVDFQNIIDLKNERLNSITPRCNLERVALDLSSKEKRTEFFNLISKQSQNALIITEGVIPYLTNDEARSLADELYQMDHFNYWITEYYSPEILSFLRTPKRLKQMEKAPFLFNPTNWFNFFKESGWKENKTKYFGVESQKIGRTPPTPGWLKSSIQSDEKKEEIKYYLAYTLYQKN